MHCSGKATIHAYHQTKCSTARSSNGGNKKRMKQFVEIDTWWLNHITNSIEMLSIVNSSNVSDITLKKISRRNVFVNNIQNNDLTHIHTHEPVHLNSWKSSVSTKSRIQLTNRNIKKHQLNESFTKFIWTKTNLTNTYSVFRWPFFPPYD